jgi:chaperonin GroES
MDLALQVVEEKTFPWPNCSNVAFPLVTIAALQFHARAYPAIIPGSEVVRAKASGFEPTPQAKAAAELVGKYMSYQLLEEDTAWEEEHDRLLLNYAIVGCAFVKTFYDAAHSHNVSELVLAQNLSIDYYAKSVDTARRKTHRYPASRNELLSGMRSDNPIYRDVAEEPWFRGDAPQVAQEPRRDGTQPPAASPATPFTLLEQHVWLDLDGDGYEEPYIAVIEHDSHTLLRLTARWERDENISRNRRGEVVSIVASEYFTKYSFIPSPDGSIYDLGFGILLGPLNESVSSAINQLMDAGTMAIAAGGFLGRGAKIRGGISTFSPFEWKRVDSTGEDLAKSIYQLPVREPSGVLFNLLGLLIDYTNRISGATETMVGESPGQNTPAETSRSMVEQGMKVYSAIFKRTWRAMKEEFRKCYILNALYAPLQFREMFLGDPRQVAPMADPNISSDSERYNRALAIAGRAQTVPGYDPAAVETNFLKALRVDDPTEFYKGFDPAQQPKDPRVQIAEIKAQTDMAKLQAANQQFMATLIEERTLNQAEIIKMQAEVTLLLAQAGDAADNREIVRMQMALAAMKAQDERIRGKVDHFLKLMELQSEPDRKPIDARAVSGLGDPSGNAPALQASPSGAPAPDGVMG